VQRTSRNTVFYHGSRMSILLNRASAASVQEAPDTRPERGKTLESYVSRQTDRLGHGRNCLRQPRVKLVRRSSAFTTHFWRCDWGHQ
jgi:hypothetical protein